MVFEYKYNTNCLKRENRVVRPTPREREKDPRPAIVHFLARLRPSDSKQKETIKSCINHPNRRNPTGKFFLFPFFRFGYEMLLLIDFFFFWLGRFRFDSFLFWVFGFSIKMSVDIFFLSFFLFFFNCQFRDLDL